jgi:DNA-binding MarR family transcriptional regulator
MQRASHGETGAPGWDALGVAARHHQRGIDAFDEAVVEWFGINRTDGRCLDVLQELGPLTAGELARATGLTTGAVTTVVDRMERAGLARRARDPHDRRKVIVALTPEAETEIAALFVPLVTEVQAALADLSEEQLDAVVAFLEADRAAHERHADVLRRRSAARDASAGGPAARPQRSAS